MENTKKNFYFTFGSNEQFPYQNGYLIVKAEDIRQAKTLFRAVHKDLSPNTINCSFWYTEEEFLSSGMQNNKCFEIISINIVIK